MSEQPFISPDDMEDISSTSASYRKKSAKAEKAAKTAVKYVNTYSKSIFKNLGNIIKGIAFVIAFAIIGVSFLLAYFLYSPDALYMAISIGIVLFGTMVAAITLFLIYGMGQIICQNDEILRRLDK